MTLSSLRSPFLVVNIVNLLSSQKVFLTNRLIALKNRLASGDVSASPEILTSEAALRSLLDSELEGSKIRSRVKWAEEGESPSGFFLGLENERHEKGSVSSVFDSEGQEVFSLPDMIQAHELELGGGGLLL